MNNTINSIKLNLKDVNKVYRNHRELAEWLKNRSNSTFDFFKAIWDFLRDFNDKSYLLKYNTLSSINATLEFDPISYEDIEGLKTLSITISSFIQEIRNYFRMLIDNSASLDEANVDEHFSNIVWLKSLDKKDEDKNNDKKDILVSQSSVKIGEWFVLRNDISNNELIDIISNLSN